MKNFCFTTYFFGGGNGSVHIHDRIIRFTFLSIRQIRIYHQMYENNPRNCRYLSAIIHYNSKLFTVGQPELFSYSIISIWTASGSERSRFTHLVAAAYLCTFPLFDIAYSFSFPDYPTTCFCIFQQVFVNISFNSLHPKLAPVIFFFINPLFSRMQMTSVAKHSGLFP